MRLVQFIAENGKRRVGVVDGDKVAPLAGVDTVRDLAAIAIDRGMTMIEAAECRFDEARESYDVIASAGRLLSPIDHPDPAHLLVTGTGLTHLGSASARANMHQAASKAADETDSMKMFRMGLEGGKPPSGEKEFSPNGFTKAMVRSLRHLAMISQVRLLPLMAARSRKLPGSISMILMAFRCASVL